MKKRHLQGALCLAAIIHIYLYGPARIEGTIGDNVSLIYYTAWEIKKLLQIPFIYGFLILAIQFFWSAEKSN